MEGRGSQLESCISLTMMWVFKLSLNVQDSDDGVIEEDPLPSMISAFVSCPEQDLDFLQKAILVGPGLQFCDR